MIELILTIASGGLAGGIVTFLAREWISTRIRTSIQHDYDLKLENHRNDFNLRIASIAHQNEMHQLKTSLFFDHQRTAYMSILNGIYEICHKWTKGWDWEHGNVWGLSSELFNEFDAVVANNLLFLDKDCEYIVNAIRFRLGNACALEDDKYMNRTSIFTQAHEDVMYLKSKLAEQFRKQIGVQGSSNALLEVSILLSRIELSLDSESLSSEGVVKLGLSKIEEIKESLKQQIRDAERDFGEDYSISWRTEELKQRLNNIEAHVK